MSHIFTLRKNMRQQHVNISEYLLICGRKTKKKERNNVHRILKHRVIINYYINLVILLVYIKVDIKVFHILETL